MKAAIFLPFLIYLPCLVLIARQLHRAPEGFEDEKGFHYGYPSPRFTFKQLDAGPASQLSIYFAECNGVFDLASLVENTNFT